MRIRKAILATAICLLLVSPVCSTWAEETETIETEPTGTEALPTESGTDPTDPEPTVTQPDPTDPDPTDPEPTLDPERLQTRILLAFEGEELVVTVTDETGSPVAGAPLVLSLDGETVPLTTDGEGIARYTPGEGVARIDCSMPPYGDYEGANARLTLQTEPPVTETEQTESRTRTTAGRPTATKAPTSTAARTDPAPTGETGSEPETVPTTAAEPTLPTVAVKADSRAAALGKKLIWLGAGLLAVALVATVLYLVFAPRKEKKKK